MKLNTLEDLFVTQLKDLYSAETQLTKALPKMAKKATTSSLAEAIENHLAETHTHVERLEEIGESLGVRLSGHKCKGMEGLIKEGSEALEKDGDDRVIDAAIIAAAQRVEHYEVSGYGTARTLALQLGHEDIAETLRQTEMEEEAADEKLTTIAEGELYPAVKMGAEEESDGASSRGRNAQSNRRAAVAR